MYQEIFAQLDGHIDLNRLGAYYWHRLREALSDATQQAENGNVAGVSLTIGVAREMVAAIDGLMMSGLPLDEMVKEKLDNK